MKRPSLISSKVLVIKIGSSLLIKKNSFNSKWLDNFSTAVDFLKKKKLKVIIVASGSVSLGKKYLGIKDSKILKINEKQACAACGQSLLMNYFIRFFKKKNLKVAQILLTFSETEDRRRNLNIRETINTLLDSGVIPVINENDSIATDELKFGDNDRLAARVGQITDADTLILLSDVEGLFDSNPFKNKEAKLIPFIYEIDDKIKKMATSETNVYGSGGMSTKIEAAQIAMNFGCNTLICSGKKKFPIKEFVKDQHKSGTWFISKKKNYSHFKRWLASSIQIFGHIIIDDGALDALNKGSSLLPSGVLKVEGNFFRGDIVEVRSKKNLLIGKGVISYDFDESKLIIGKKTSQIESILGYIGRDEIIHRDNFIFNDKVK